VPRLGCWSGTARARSVNTGPAELYRLVAELALLVDGLPQLLNQLDRWLHTEHDAGRIRSDNSTDPTRMISDAATQLANAGDAAHDLGRALDYAHQHLAHLGATEPDRTTNQRGQFSIAARGSIFERG